MNIFRILQVQSLKTLNPKPYTLHPKTFSITSQTCKKQVFWTALKTCEIWSPHNVILKKLKTNYLVCKQLLHTSWLARILNCWLRVNHFLLLHIFNLSFLLPRPSKKEKTESRQEMSSKTDWYSQNVSHMTSNPNPPQARSSHRIKTQNPSSGGGSILGGSPGFQVEW